MGRRLGPPHEGKNADHRFLPVFASQIIISLVKCLNISFYNIDLAYFTQSIR